MKSLKALIILTLFTTTTISATPLTLKEANAQLVVGNPILQIKQSEIRQSKLTRLATKMDRLPKLDLSADRIHNDLRGTNRLTSSIPLNQAQNPQTDNRKHHNDRQDQQRFGTTTHQHPIKNL